MNRAWMLALFALLAVGVYMGRGAVARGTLGLLERFEGRKDRAYKDSAGFWTIGVGHKVLESEMTRYVGRPITLNGKQAGSVVITDAEIDRLAAQDEAIASGAVSRLVKVPLNANERAALVSFVFNLGAGNLASSTLLRLLNAGDRAGAAAQFGRWNKAAGVEVPGLTARRAAERVLFEATA